MANLLQGSSWYFCILKADFIFAGGDNLSIARHTSSQTSYRCSGVEGRAIAGANRLCAAHHEPTISTDDNCRWKIRSSGTWRFACDCSTIEDACEFFWLLKPEPLTRPEARNPRISWLELVTNYEPTFPHSLRLQRKNEASLRSSKSRFVNE